MPQENREAQRINSDIVGKYIVEPGSDEEYPCTIEDVSEKGFGFLAEADKEMRGRPKGGIKKGMIIQVIIGDMKLDCKVIYEETCRVGVYFINATQEQKDTLKKLVGN